MKIIILGLVLLSSSLTFASAQSRICVANKSGVDLEWQVSNLSLFFIKQQPTHSSKNVWRCLTVPSKNEGFTVRISNKDLKYSSDSCYVTVNPNEWVVVKSSLNCEASNEAGENRDTQYKNLLSVRPVQLLIKADFQGPLQGSIAQIVTEQGNVLSGSLKEDINSNGFYRVPVVEIPENQTLLVELKNEKLSSSLYAIIPFDFDFERGVLGVNLATTLVSKLVLDERMDLKKATALVSKYFSQEDRGYLGMILSPPFLPEHLTEVPLNDLVSNLLQEIDKGVLFPKTRLALNDPVTDWAKDTGADFLKKYTKSLAENIVTQLPDSPAGNLLKKILIFPKEDQTAEEIAKIKNILAQQQKILEGIQTQLNALKNQVDQAIILIKKILTQQELNHFETMNANLFQTIARINSDYKDLIDISSGDPTIDHGHQIALLRDRILNNTRSYLELIHMVLTGSEGFNRPVIELYREILKKKEGNKGYPRFISNEYLAPMNQYYGYYYRIQLMATNLLIEAHHSLVKPDPVIIERIFNSFIVNTTHQLAIAQIPNVNLVSNDLILDRENNLLLIKKFIHYSIWNTPLIMFDPFVDLYLKSFKFAEMPEWTLVTSKQLDSWTKEAGSKPLIDYFNDHGFVLNCYETFLSDKLWTPPRCIYHIGGGGLKCSVSKRTTACMFMVHKWTPITPPPLGY